MAPPVGQPLIAYWPAGAPDVAGATLENLRTTLAPETEIQALDESRSFGSALNALLGDRDGFDVAIVADACALPEGWLARVERAATIDDTIAAASTLAVGPGGPLFAGFDGDPVFAPAKPPEGLAVGAPAQGATGQPTLHPRLFRLWPHCSYVRGATIQLLGPFDESLSHPGAVLVEYAARALSRGLSCVLADDVVVERLQGGLRPVSPTEMAQIRALHPWLDAALDEEEALEFGALRHSLLRARTAGRILSVTIDARALGSDARGTQTYQAGLVMALARSGRLTVRAVVRDAASEELIGVLEGAGVRVIREGTIESDRTRTDVAHRPQQVFVPEDLRLLRHVGERVVVSHLDLIAFRNPGYHSSIDEWRRFRRLTRIALGAADRVIFNSDHSRRDAVADELIEPEYTAIVGVGIDPPPANLVPRPPAGVNPDHDLLVLIGSDYLHKNRLFALELVDQLRLRHGWQGQLVLAGGHVPHGGSAGAEAELLNARPELAEHVLDVGPVGEDEKRWLLEHARALLCPSTYEGFGLTPLEAAATDTPCVYAPTTSLREVLGPDAATILPWDAAASADLMLPLLHERGARENHLKALRSALGRYAWDSIADELYEVYCDAIDSPYRSSVQRAWEESVVREELIVDLDRRYQDLRERVAFGLALIDRDGLLTMKQQRGLMRLASRGWLRRPLLGPFGLLGRVRSRDTPASLP